MNDPNYVCPSCVHNDKGTSAWPCRACSRINQMCDHYTPADGSEAPRPKNLDAFLHDHADAESITRMVFGKLGIWCGSCPAAIVCMNVNRDQPDEGDDNCLAAFQAWLEQEGPT